MGRRRQEGDRTGQREGRLEGGLGSGGGWRQWQTLTPNPMPPSEWETWHKLSRFCACSIAVADQSRPTGASVGWPGVRERLFPYPKEPSSCFLTAEIRSIQTMSFELTKYLLKPSIGICRKYIIAHKALSYCPLIYNSFDGWDFICCIFVPLPERIFCSFAKIKE